MYKYQALFAFYFYPMISESFLLPSSDNDWMNWHFNKFFNGLDGDDTHS